MTKDREYFVENLAMLIDSGMDILSALEAIKSEIKSKKFRDTIAHVQEDIAAWSPLWQAFETAKILPAPQISLVRIGETSGQLAENLNLIAAQDQKERTFTSKIRSAMIYPLLVLSLTGVIGIGIAWFILPHLATVFTDLKLQLPLITKILIGIGVFLGHYGIIAVPTFVVGVIAIFYFLFFYQKTKFIGQSIMFNMPIMNSLMKEVELARFGHVLGTLLEAGLPVLNALHSVTESTSLQFYKKFYAFLQDNIKEGNTFQKSFNTYNKSAKLFPRFIQQIISAAEKSGNLGSALIKIGKNYEEKTETTAKNLTVMLEPLLLIIIWLGVIAVALAVILPIYSLIGNLNH